MRFQSPAIPSQGVQGWDEQGRTCREVHTTGVVQEGGQGCWLLLRETKGKPSLRGRFQTGFTVKT